MSTSANIVVKPEVDSVVAGEIYIHFQSDGYPSEALKQLINAFRISWGADRLESGDLAVAIVATAKMEKYVTTGHGGGIYLGDANYHGDWHYDLHLDSKTLVISKYIAGTGITAVIDTCDLHPTAIQTWLDNNKERSG